MTGGRDLREKPLRLCELALVSPPIAPFACDRRERAVDEWLERAPFTGPRQSLLRIHERSIAVSGEIGHERRNEMAEADDLHVIVLVRDPRRLCDQVACFVEAAQADQEECLERVTLGIGTCKVDPRAEG